MNRYTLSELTAGTMEHFSVTVTREMMERFFTITGDQNPLHQDEAYAKQCGYPGTVVYGMLTASFLSTLAGVYLPGEHSLIHSVETKFTTPVFVGDTLTVSGEVSDVNEVFSIIMVKTKIVNQKGETVSRGKMQIGIRANHS